MAHATPTYIVHATKYTHADQLSVKQILFTWCRPISYKPFNLLKTVKLSSQWRLRYYNLQAIYVLIQLFLN